MDPVDLVGSEMFSRIIDWEKYKLKALIKGGH